MSALPRTSLKNRELVKVVICGDRNWKLKYVNTVRKIVRALVKKHGTKDLLIIEGGAPGVDTIVREICKRENVHCAQIEALWEKRHRSAGSQRNEIMALLKPDEVIGVHADIENSKGTARMLKIADTLGIPTRLYKGRRLRELDEYE